MSNAKRLLFALVFAFPSLASAKSIAVLGLEPIDVPDADAARLTDAIRKQLDARPGLTQLPGKDTVEMKLAFGCSDDADAGCMAQAGKSISADQIIYGSLRGRGAQRLVTLRLVDVSSGTVVRYVAGESVTAAELSADTAGVASRLVATLLGGGGAAGTGSIAVSSDPPGATVVIDGETKGTSPMTVAGLAPGEHKVELAKEGYKPFVETQVLKAGQVAKLEAPLAAVETPSIVGTASEEHTQTVEEKPGRGLRIAAVVTGAAALAAAGVAIYTWRHYSSLQDDAHAQLAAAQMDPGNAAYARDPVGASWFSQPNCAPPPASNGAPAPSTRSLQTYTDTCNSGTSYANLTTGLVIGAGVLAAASVATLALSLTARPERQTSAFHPRLRALAPSASPTGAGITAAFEF